jgi:phage gp46-like protein
MATAITWNIDPTTRSLTLDDGQLAAAPSEAVGLVVWTLCTPYGTCPAAPDLGVRWDAAKTAVQGATVTLQKELVRALQWVVDLGFLRNFAVTVTSPASGRLRYEIAFDPPEGGRTTLRGTV